MAKGLFISARGYLEGAIGGVQICTKEYMDVIRAAGIELTILPFDLDRRLVTRILRQFDSSPFFRPFEPFLPSVVARLARQIRFDFVFLNQVSLMGLASRIRHSLPDKCRIVSLSHGLE